MTNVNMRVQKHRDALRRAGLRPVQIWVPDTRRPDFVDECRRQCQTSIAHSTGDVDLITRFRAIATQRLAQWNKRDEGSMMLRVGVR